MKLYNCVEGMGGSMIGVKPATLADLRKAAEVMGYVVVPQTEDDQHHELHQAARQLLRYNGVDRGRAVAAGERLAAATHAITDSQEADQ